VAVIRSLLIATIPYHQETTILAIFISLTSTEYHRKKLQGLQHLIDDLITGQFHRWVLQEI
jgi:succinate dehydrogenase hydrophobic anchor subunit